MFQKDIDKYENKLDYFELIKLRDRIGNGYLVAENISWCDIDKHFKIIEVKMNKDGEFKKAIMPIISGEFKNIDQAKECVEEVRDVTDELNIDIHDVDYVKENMSFGIAFKPYTFN